MEQIVKLVVSSDSYITTVRLKDSDDSREAMASLAHIAKKSGYAVSKTRTPLMMDIFSRKLGIIKEHVGVIAYDNSIENCKMMLGNTDAERILNFLNNSDNFRVSKDS